MSVTVVLTLNGVEVPVELDDAALATIAHAVADVRCEAASPWLTVDQAAAYLGLTPHAIRKLYETHRVPKHQPGGAGGRIFLRRFDLDVYVSGGS